MAGVVVRDPSRRGLLARFAFVAIFAGFLIPFGTTAAYAGGGGGGVVCPPTGPCTVTVHAPGDHGSSEPVEAVGHGSTPSGSAQCHFEGQSFPCDDPVLGWWNAADDCFFRQADRPSGPSDPINDGIASGYHPPGDGTYYDFVCPGVNGTGGGYAWLPSPPPGSPRPALPAPAVLAQRAVRQLGLAGPDIQTSPPAGREQVVGLPTWLWTRVTQATWGSHAATAAVPGESVTATATAERIVWDLGDGTTVTCDGPGTAYRQGMDPRTASPDCGHTYTVSSAGQPDQAYAVTATTTWRVHWTGAGAQGQLTIRRTSRTSLRVAEAQAVNR